MSTIRHFGPGHVREPVHHRDTEVSRFTTEAQRTQRLTEKDTFCFSFLFLCVSVVNRMTANAPLPANGI